jgi:hypothetical protein
MRYEFGREIDARGSERTPAKVNWTWEKSSSRGGEREVNSPILGDINSI